MSEQSGDGRERVYVAADWPHGLRCLDCHTHFVEGQPIAERLTGIDTCDDLAYLPGANAKPDEPLFYVEIICVGCDLAVADQHVAVHDRHGFGVCATGSCVEPCGPDGGCSR